MLNPIDIARNSLIDEILSIDNISMLENLKKVIAENKSNSQVKISQHQLEILKQSDLDIKANRIIANDIAHTNDLKWLTQQ